MVESTARAGIGQRASAGIPDEPRDVAGRVLIIVENIAASMDHRVSKQVDTLLERGYFVCVITRRHPLNRRYRRLRRVRLLEYPSPAEPSNLLGYLAEYGYSFLVATALSLRVALFGRFDVVQFCQPPDFYFPLAKLLRMLGVRVLVDQRDLLSELYGDRYGEARSGMLPAIRWFEKLSHRSAERVICVNDYLKKQVAASGLPQDRISVVRNGPVLARVLGVAGDDVLKRGRRYLCCWLGMIGRQDRVDLLLRAVHHVVYGLGRRDSSFVVIGDGECLAEVQSLARDLNLGEWVHFTGWLSEEDVFRYLATADLGLDASLQVEVSPVKAMEYMAFGVPLVAFDLPETRAISEGAAGYAAPGDVMALARRIDVLLESPQGRAALGRRGRLRVQEELAWERQADTYVEVIEQLCSARRRVRKTAAWSPPHRDV
jgi:glycosyltransferase involved in cell wall biosynthesis